jgi:hypothetical protein
MRKTKKEKLEAVVKLFHKEKVLTIDQLFAVFKTKSRRTVHRYMKELEYRTSYSHAGQYYTLFEIAEFDANGLWRYNDIGFSRHGTLLDTIVYLVDRSPEGMTNNELQEKFHLVVKAALIDLVKKKMLVREKRTNRYVYVSPDPSKGQKQLKQRTEFTTDSLIDDSISLRVLLMAYRLVGRSVSPVQVATGLKKEGSKISLEVVHQVFQKYDIGKKTLDFTSSQS